MSFTMEGGPPELISMPEMYQKSHTLSFLGRRSFVPRPLSEATEIFDTDVEDDEDSPVSLDSASTLSSINEATTPPGTGGLGDFEFHFDHTVTGPYRPHLFMAEPKYNPRDLAITMSPLPQIPESPLPQSAPAAESASRHITSLNSAVAELDEATVRSWTPEQVADWMTTASFESSVVDKFLVHDICGTVLLDLQFEDLKELDISSFGKRHQVMTKIENLRNSTLITTPPITRKASQVSRSESRRRGRHQRASIEDIHPAESASIVAIEQVLPQPHHCHKGDDCPKYQKQQRKIQRIEEQFAADIKSIVAPSTVASSDIFGPSPGVTITPERLESVEPRDPLENVRNFISFQHVNSPIAIAPFSQNLNGLPKLTIPTENKNEESPYHTPIAAFRNPTEQQAKLKAELVQDPYHYGGVASPVDVYRLGTPMSANDMPITALPIDPCHREVSHSVPPEMKYGAPAMSLTGDPIIRPHSTQPCMRRPRRPSFIPNMAALSEMVSPGFPPVTSEADLANQRGWMRKRKTARLLRHEWQDNYFTLSGTQLGIAKDESSEVHQSINVDEYVLHTYTPASSSKLSAAFKKSVGASSTEPTFAFSLIPEDRRQKKFFEKDRSHHFAVNSGNDRVEWMRKLMLAKAMKKNGGQI